MRCELAVMKIINLSLRNMCLGGSALAASFFLVSCEVRQTQEAKAPEVEVKEGQLPKYDVDPAKVTVEGEKKEITVPEITTEKKTITVPDVDITMPSEMSPTPAAMATPTPAP